MMEAERKRPGKRRLPRQKSFTEALKEKYCSPEIDSCNSGGFVVNIVYHGKPKTNGSDAELAYLRNVVLCDRRVSKAGIPSDGLRSLCPNVIDLDLSGNLLDDWSEVVNIISHLPFLKFLNLSRNKLVNKQNFLQNWGTSLDKIESLVLNETDVAWDEVLTVASHLPSLQELHTCKNGYTHLSSSTLRGLEKVKYLKMNYNQIDSWEEVWKLRHLPELDTLILSGNPLKDVVYKHIDDTDHVCIETDNTATDDIDISSNQDEEDDENGNKSPAQYATDVVEQVLVEAFSELEQTILDKSEVVQQNKDRTVVDRTADNDRKIDNDRTSENDSNADNDRTAENDSNADNDRTADNDRNIDNDSNADNDRTADNDRNIDNDSNADNDRKIDNDRTAENDSNADNDRTADNDRNIDNDSNADNDRTADNERTADNKVPVNFYLEPEENHNDSSSGQDRKAFRKLKSLCVSDTCIHSWDHLWALSSFPNLESLRIQNIKLMSEMGEDDRRKLKIASLPNIKFLNGSEVFCTEREKAERYFIRYFMEQESQPERYKELEAKHGKLKPIVDIDISRGFMEEAKLTFSLNGMTLSKETFKVKDIVHELRVFIMKKLGIRQMYKLFHYGCGPYHPKNEEVLFQELQSPLLQMSRYDIMDGDEIQIRLSNPFRVREGSLQYLNVLFYLVECDYK